MSYILTVKYLQPEFTKTIILHYLNVCSNSTSQWRHTEDSIGTHDSDQHLVKKCKVLVVVVENDKNIDGSPAGRVICIQMRQVIKNGCK